MLASSALFCSVMCWCRAHEEVISSTKSFEELVLAYEDDKNAMIAITEKEDDYFFEDFYEEFENQVKVEQSMNMIFFSPPKSFMRLSVDSILFVLANTNKRLIPISRTLLAWDIILDGRSPAALKPREFRAFGYLLNLIPEEDLYYVNFSDSSVLRFFANNNVGLDKRKYGVLAASYRRHFGNRWITNHSYINSLGYLICGFPWYQLESIPPEELYDTNADVLNKLDFCDVNQTKALYNLAIHPDAFDRPYRWTSHEITKLGLLLMYIPEKDISGLRMEAVAAISPVVMRRINQEKLVYFTRQQILRMNWETRRIFILRVQLKNSLDMGLLATDSALVLKPIVFVIILCFATLLHIRESQYKFI